MNTNVENKYHLLHEILTSYWNYDVHTTEEGLKDLFQNSTDYINKFLIDTANFISDKQFSDQEKNEFIFKSVPNVVPQTDLQWLEDVAHQIEEHLKQ